MENATWHTPTPGYRTSGSAETGIDFREGNYASLEALADAARQAGVEEVLVTPLEHSGQNWYYGPGEYRYLHGQAFVMTVLPAKEPDHYQQDNRQGYHVGPQVRFDYSHRGKDEER